MKKLNNSGFAGVLVLIIIGIIAIGGVGYYVYHANKQTNKTLNQTSAQTKATHADVYAGWKTATMASTNLSFKYPAAWSIKNNSSPLMPASGSQPAMIMDQYDFAGQQGFAVEASAGNMGHPSLDGPTKVYYAQKVNFNGQTGYVDYISGVGKDSGQVATAMLSKSATDPLNVFTGTLDGTTYNIVLIASTKAPLSLQAAKTSSAYKDFVLMVESLKSGAVVTANQKNS